LSGHGLALRPALRNIFARRFFVFQEYFLLQMDQIEHEKQNEDLQHTQAAAGDASLLGKPVT
jgi:hypothetical protein